MTPISTDARTGFRKCTRCGAPIRSTAHRCEDYLPKPKNRAPKRNPIPAPAPKAAPLKPGEKHIPETARVLLIRLEQQAARERQQILDMVARDLKLPMGVPLDVDFNRWTIAVAKPDAPKGRAAAE